MLDAEAVSLVAELKKKAQMGVITWFQPKSITTYKNLRILRICTYNWLVKSPSALPCIMSPNMAVIIWLFSRKLNSYLDFVPEVY